MAYASKSFSSQELVWPVREKEALAIVRAVTYFKEFLRFAPSFTVRTDHQSLGWMWKCNFRKVARWALLLQEYNFTIMYTPGTQQQHVDMVSMDVPNIVEEEGILSRIALPTQLFPMSLTTPQDELPTLQDIRTQTDEELQTDLGLRKVLKINNGVYVNSRNKIYIPKDLRQDFLFYFHYSRNGGHVGMNTSLRRMKQWAWWPRMEEDVRIQAESCLTCLRRRPPTKDFMGDLIVVQPFEVVQSIFSAPYN